MLLNQWKANKEEFEKKQIQQIVGFAGEGKLKDGSKCATEVRDYLAQIEIGCIESYIKQCLEKPFTDSGLVLQDLVNEIGRRLDFEVEDGLYQGRQNKIGFDGIWRAPEGFAIVVEVKTTDAYRITLDKISKYRQDLIKAGKITEDSSILIVVGREDTGDLEAQVRGSRHAWDIRIIHAEALLKLTKVKVSSEEDTSTKMRQLLRPVEYTRLDALVDIIYTTSQDSEEEEIADSTELDVSSKADLKKGVWAFTDKKVLDDLRSWIILTLNALYSKELIKRTKATYWSSDRKLRVVCTISKRYEREGKNYWFAYHSAWEEFLRDSDEAYVALGCVDKEVVFVLPRKVLLAQLEYLNTTEKVEGKPYWHLVIAETEDGEYKMALPKINKSLDLKKYTELLRSKYAW